MTCSPGCIVEMLHRAQRQNVAQGALPRWSPGFTGEMFCGAHCQDVPKGAGRICSTGCRDKFFRANYQDNPLGTLLLLKA